MKLEQLVQVVEVANTQSISKAAANLFMTQPGLSFSLKQLENELGTDLFIRNSKGVELTEAGDSFVAQAKKILNQVNALERSCKGNFGETSRTLSIAAGHYRFIGPLTAAFFNHHKNDGTKFVLRTGATQDCIDWVANGVCDVGITHYLVAEEKDFQWLMKQKQLQYHKIYESQITVIIGEGHPLFHTDATEIDAAELAKYPQIAHDHTSAKDYYRSVFLTTAGNNLRVIVTELAALYEMLDYSDGYCYGFASDYVYENFPRQHKARKLKIRKTGKHLSMAMAWIAPANVELEPLASEFVNIAVDACTKSDFWQLHPQLKNTQE